jgi:hypothetical protein
MRDLKSICEGIQHYLKDYHCLDSTFEIAGDKAQVDIRTEEGDEFYIGNYADPGLTVELAGELEGVQMVRVNSIYIQALASHIAGWAVGYDA